MRQKRTYVTILLVIALLCLGIAYAAITNTTLNISGNVAASATSEKIDVVFTKADKTTVPENASVVATVDANDATKATIEVSGLTTAGQTVVATYTIKNNRTDVAATLDDPAVTNSNTDWFEVTSAVAANDLAAEGETTATVTVKLLKTPVTTADETAAKATVSIDIVASPVANN